MSGAATREEAAVTKYEVREDIISSNTRPKFPDQSTLGITGDPARESTERFILEDSPAGTPVGARVTAFDDATEIEVLTYSLSSLSDATPGSDHADNFDINPATGQITVSAKAMLDVDGDAAVIDYMVIVRAIDGDGDTQNITVSIKVVGVNEPPMITVRPPRDEPLGERTGTARGTATRDRHRSGQQCPVTMAMAPFPLPLSSSSIRLRPTWQWT